MRLLLDTHLFLWALDGSLSSKARDVLDSADDVYVSAASIWEISIKARLGRLDADPAEIARQIGLCGFLALPISLNHAAYVYQLPVPDGDHKDPFDRMLVAQALSEPLILVTADKQLAKYGAQTVVV